MKGALRMIGRPLLLVALALAIAACEGRNPAPALDLPVAEPVEAPALEASPLPEPASADGFELIDTPAGISIAEVAIRDELTGLTPPKFELHCNSKAKTLEAVAPARQFGEGAAAGPAAFVASGARFEGEAVMKDEGSARVSLTLPLSPDLLAAIATTVTARVVIGDSFAESNVDKTGALPGFAGQCSLKSGVPLPPP
jgi:hypothetical protein